MEFSSDGWAGLAAGHFKADFQKWTAFGWEYNLLKSQFISIGARPCWLGSWGGGR